MATSIAFSVPPSPPASPAPTPSPRRAADSSPSKRPLPLAHPRADAIVVLGCRSSAGLMRRVDVGVRLFQAGAAPVLLLSGGGGGPVPEAEMMRHMALARGVPEAALLVEPRSPDTQGNAHEAARLLGECGGRSVLLVSDRVHLPRAALLFRLAGLRIAGWARPRPPSIWWEIGAAIRECVALPRSLARVVVLCWRR